MQHRSSVAVELERAFRVLAGYAVLLLGVSTPSMAAFELKVEISGMVAVIPALEEKAVRLVAVNALEADHHDLPHTAALIVNCRDLVDQAQQTACTKFEGGWSEPPWEDVEGSAFDLSKGYDIRLLNSANSELATGLTRSAALDRSVVAMNELSERAATAHADLSAAAIPELLDRVVFRMSLRAGLLGAGGYDAREGWTFVTARGGAAKHTVDRVVSVLSWQMPVSQASIQVQLKSYDGTTTTAFELKPPAGEDVVEVQVRNEPTKEAFCRQEPTINNPFLTHFEEFFNLAESTEGVERVYPRYDGTKRPCLDRFSGRPPIFCMVVSFDPAQQTW